MWVSMVVMRLLGKAEVNHYKGLRPLTGEKKRDLEANVELELA